MPGRALDRTRGEESTELPSIDLSSCVKSVLIPAMKGTGTGAQPACDGVSRMRIAPVRKHWSGEVGASLSDGRGSAILTEEIGDNPRRTGYRQILGVASPTDQIVWIGKRRRKPHQQSESDQHGCQ